MKKYLVLILLMLLQSNIALAENKKNPLQDFLKNFNSLESNFIQQIINENGEVLEKSEGVLQLQKPGKFNWTYTTPYAQKIISNGDVIWMYDEDLEQITIRNIGNELDETPAGIILGNNNINEHFVQVNIGVIEGYNWIELTPRSPETQYQNIRIGFHNAQLGMMIIVDSLGQTTRIDFINVKKNTDLPPSSFEFVVPPDIDVIDEREIAATS